jgi:alpha-beta hydrolase superfamily lysophospholipase
VLLIAGSGPTDRNGNSALEKGPVDTLKTLADWLSGDGVATLRYDKLGSGKTGLGPYATKLDSIGIGPFEQESAAALTFLAHQKGVNDKLLGVFGHSEGALFALLLATGHAGPVPAIHALGLVEPLSNRYLTLLSVQLQAEITAQLRAGQISKSLAATVDATLTSAITRLRATGKVKANLKYGLATLLNASDAKFIQQADRFDPKALARALSSATPVLVTCSTADTQVSCLQVGRIVQGLRGAGAHYQLVQMVGVDHVLKVDATGSPANYTKKLPFSPMLRAALKEFVTKNL